MDVLLALIELLLQDEGGGDTDNAPVSHAPLI